VPNSFILQDIVRRYFRDDLKTGAYVSGMARLVFVTLVLTAVQLIAPFESPELQAVLGFMVGFFPQIGLQAMQAALSKPMGAELLGPSWWVDPQGSGPDVAPTVGERSTGGARPEGAYRMPMRAAQPVGPRRRLIVDPRSVSGEAPSGQGLRRFNAECRCIVRTPRRG
jgi:hypothetical protein